MAITFLFAGLAVADLAESIAWYERLLGRPPDMLPHDGEAVWRVAETGSVYLLAAAGTTGHGLVTLVVEDLASYVAELAGRGVTTAPIEEIPGAGWKATVSDPSGNTISFVEISNA